MKLVIQVTQVEVSICILMKTSGIENEYNGGGGCSIFIAGSICRSNNAMSSDQIVRHRMHNSHTNTSYQSSNPCMIYTITMVHYHCG